MLFGKPLKDVIDDLKRKLKNSEYVSKTLDIILSIFYAGGDVVRVLRDLYYSIQTIKNTNKEKNIVLTQQVIILVLIFLIFVFIIQMIYTNLVPYLYTVKVASDILSKQGKVIGLDIVKPSLSFEFIRLIFILLLFFSGISIGAIVGMIMGRTYTSVFRYSMVFFAISFIIYNFILAPPVLSVMPQKGAFYGYSGSYEDIEAIVTLNAKPLVNKTIMVKFAGNEFLIETDQYGIAKFRLYLPKKKGKYQISFCIKYKYDKIYCYTKDFYVK